MYSCQIYKIESAQISEGLKHTVIGMEKSLTDLTVQVGKSIEDLGSTCQDDCKCNIYNVIINSLAGYT